MVPDAKDSLVRPRGIRHFSEGRPSIDTRLLDKIPAAAILTDLEGRVQYWNDSATRLFGWTAKEMVGRMLAERFPEHVRPWLRQEMEKRAFGEDWEGEFEDYHKDGSRIWIDARVSAITNDDGQPIAILGISHDITDRKLTESQLRESERRLAEAQRIARLASWVWDPNTNRVWWSDGIYELFGVEPGLVEPSFESFLALLHPDDVPLAIARARAVHAGTEVVANDLRLIRPDGKLIWIHSRSRATKDADGRIIRVEGTDQDITERKLAEQTLRVSEERNRLFVDHDLDAVMIHDGRGNIIDVNRQACDALGYQREELIGKSPLDFDTQFSEQKLSAMRARLKRGECVVFETEHRRRNGETFPVEVRVRPFPTAEASAGMAIAFARDLTEFKINQWRLQESQDRLRSIGDNLPGGIIFVYRRSVDGSNSMVYASKSCEELLGVTADQLVQDPSVLHNMISEEERRRFQEALDYSAATQNVLDIELGIVRKENDRRWLHWRATPRREADGGIVWEGVALDITTRKLAELALRVSEERLRLATLATNDAIWDLDLNTGFVVSNDNFMRLFGRCPINATTIDWWKERLHPDDRQRVSDSLQQAIEDHSNNWRGEYRFRMPDGTWAEIEDHAHISRDVQGRAQRMVGAMRNVTERNRVERAYRESEERFRSVLNHSPAMIFLKDLLGRYLFVNEQCAKAHGNQPKDWIGKTVRDFLCVDTAACMESLEKRVIQERTSVQMEVEARRSNGKCQTLLTVHFPLRKPDGEIYGLCGIATDITEQKRLEEQIRQSQKMEAIGQLAGGVAHDFNNLLTVIRGYSELLLTDQSQSYEERQDQLRAICEAGDRAAGLTAQLLAFSRKAIIDPKVIDLNRAIESFIRLLQRLIGEHIRMQTRLSPQLWRVKIDPVQLEQTLMNLAVNARDAMPRGGILTISTQNVQDASQVRGDNSRGGQPEPPSGEYVSLTFADNGIGMNEEVKAHLFEPFFTTKGAGRGTGMGLATVYGIVHQAGGFIHVDSQPDEGTSFRIYLPAVLDKPTQHLGFNVPGALRGTETILLVEDEDAVRQLAKMILEMHGYTVLSAACGIDALAAMRTFQGHIDLLLSDVVMPDLPGSELADEVRRIRPEVRVLYMSGYTDDTVVRRGVASADGAFLPKPFTPASLTQKVREVMDD